MQQQVELCAHHLRAYTLGQNGFCNKFHRGCFPVPAILALQSDGWPYGSDPPKAADGAYCRMYISDEVVQLNEFLGTNGSLIGMV
jgi:hypothetical protein